MHLFRSEDEEIQIFDFSLTPFLATFILVALASDRIGQVFSRFRLPLISGFLAAGILAGPYILDLVSSEAVAQLRFVDEISLAYIAYAAGNELSFEELRSRLKSIISVTTGITLVTFIVGSTAVFLLADLVPFMQTMSVTARIAVSILAGSILVARSPSSAIAIINELRAKGPFTRTVLGVTVVSDVAVILLFGLSSSAADALLTELSFNLNFIALLLVELLVSLIVGWLLARLLQMILASHLHSFWKSGLVLISGYAIFLFSAMLRSYSHDNWSSEVLLEPLLICMIGSFIVTNYSPYREDFMHILHDLGPAVYIAFFTLTGASLAVDVLIQTWAIALAIFVIRLVAIFVGSYAGGMTAGDSPKFNRIAWMTYLTQAGVGLGLAKEVAVEFPEWGGTFATIMISVIIFSQLVGPPLFKWAISRAGEAHPRGQSAEFDGVRDALIFGLTAQSVSLALQLRRHDWQVKLICVNRTKMQELATPEVDVHFVEDLSLDVLRKLDAEHADALVSFLSDEQSYQLCEMAYEHFGTETMVVRLRDRSNFERFHSLDVRVVEPRTAVSSLLEHFVLAPAGTSLLLGMDEEQEMIDIEVRDPTLHGRALRDLRLPLEVLILSIHRAGHTLVTRGHTELHLGDKVTMVGPRDKLDEVTLRFDS